MAKVFQIPPVPGVKDVFTLLSFLAEQEVYEEHLEDLIAIRDECVMLINKVADVNEITALKQQAENALSVAQAHVATAQDQAIQRRKQAEDEAKDILAKAVADSQAAAQLKADLEQKAALFAKEVDLKGKAIDQQTMELKSRLNSLAVTEAKAKALKEDYEAKVKKLNEAMGL